MREIDAPAPRQRSGRALAVAQTCPVPGDVAANTDAHCRMAALAAEAGARVVVFPELSLTGYELDLANDLAFTSDDVRLEPLCDAATRHAITIIAGAPVRIECRLHIGALIIRPDAAPLVYTKHRLGAFSEDAARFGTVPPAEATVFEPGTLDPRVTFGEGSAALAICADIGLPEHAQRAADAGANAYLAGMFVIPSDLEADTERLQRYATHHRMVVAFANYGAPTGGLAAAGSSTIWSDTGARIARVEGVGAGLAVAIERDGSWQGMTLRVTD